MYIYVCGCVRTLNIDKRTINGTLMLQNVTSEMYFSYLNLIRGFFFQHFQNKPDIQFIEEFYEHTMDSLSLMLSNRILFNSPFIHWWSIEFFHWKLNQIKKKEQIAISRKEKRKYPLTKMVRLSWFFSSTSKPDSYDEHRKNSFNKNTKCLCCVVCIYFLFSLHNLITSKLMISPIRHTAHCATDP